MAAISSQHTQVNRVTVGSHRLVSLFLKGALRLHPPKAQRAPAWDLPLVLEALCQSPFEPMDCGYHWTCLHNQCTTSAVGGAAPLYKSRVDIMGCPMRGAPGLHLFLSPARFPSFTGSMFLICCGAAPCVLCFQLMMLMKFLVTLLV